MSRGDQFEEALKAGDKQTALEIIDAAPDHNEGGQCVFVALWLEDTPQEIVEAALQKFLDLRVNLRPHHGQWVHSLSGATRLLWERRMVGWIKKFNEVAFRGANELGDSNCSDRLVDCFGEHAQWNDDPADFHLTPDNLRWMDWEYATQAKTRLDAGRFDSEESFLRWQLSVPSEFADYYGVVEVDRVRRIIGRLIELGVDAKEFENTEQSLIEGQIATLQAELRVCKDWNRSPIKERIEKLRSMLHG